MMGTSGVRADTARPPLPYLRLASHIGCRCRPPGCGHALRRVRPADVGGLKRPSRGRVKLRIDLGPAVLTFTAIGRNHIKIREILC